MLSRKLIGSLGLIAMLGAGVVALPSPAHAETDLLTCLGTETVQFTPGVTTTVRPIHGDVHDELTTCAVPNDPTITGGSVDSTFDEQLSCLVSEPVGPVTKVFQWSNGSSTTAHFTTAVVEKPLGQSIVIRTGTVTAGQFEGAQAVLVVTTATLDPLQCLTPTGVTSSSGSIAITFTSP